VSVRKLDAAVPEDFAASGERVETILCVNVLEYVPDPSVTLRCIHDCLESDGVLLVLVPRGHGLHGTLDATLGHRRRFEERELCGLLEQAGFSITSLHQLNKFGTPAWWFHGRVFRRQHIGKLTLKIFDKTVWLWRRLDPLMPWKGLSLIAVARRSD
jgi:SAM-dependent methyltransferase